MDSNHRPLDPESEDQNFRIILDTFMELRIFLDSHRLHFDFRRFFLLVYLSILQLSFVLFGIIVYLFRDAPCHVYAT